MFGHCARWPTWSHVPPCEFILRGSAGQEGVFLAPSGPRLGARAPEGTPYGELPSVGPSLPDAGQRANANRAGQRRGWTRQRAGLGTRGEGHGAGPGRAPGAQVLLVRGPSEGSLFPLAQVGTDCRPVQSSRVLYTETRTRPSRCSLKARSHVAVTHHWLPPEAWGTGSQRGRWPRACPTGRRANPAFVFPDPFVPICSHCR